MPVLRGLTVIVGGADSARFSLALEMAASTAAVGAPARLYAHQAAVTLLVPSPAIEDALELGVRFVACQSGLADHGLAIPDFAEAGGMVSLLAELGDDRLVTV